MSDYIDGTEDYTGGPYKKVVATDSGNEADTKVNEFMERMAVHNHSNIDSAASALPANTIRKFDSLSFALNAYGSDYAVYISTAASGTSGEINFSLKMPEFYYKLTTDADSIENWYRFYPTYETDSDGLGVTLTVNRNDIDIRVVA